MIVDAAYSVDVADIVAVLRRPPYVEVRELEVVPEDSAARPRELGSDGALAHVVGDGRPQADDARAVVCLLYTSPSPRDRTRSRMPSSA